MVTDASGRGFCPIFGLKLKLRLCRLSQLANALFSAKKIQARQTDRLFGLLSGSPITPWPKPVIISAPPDHPCAGRRRRHSGSHANRPRLHTHYHPGRVQTRAIFDRGPALGPRPCTVQRRSPHFGDGTMAITPPRHIIAILRLHQETDASS